MSKKHPKPHASRRILISVLCAALTLLLIVLAWLLLKPETTTITTGGSDFFDASAKVGNLPGRTQEEIIAELNKSVEEGMFNISISSIIVFADGESEGQARIENIAANPYHMSVEITLDETGETVYQSKGLAPGQYIEYITLNTALPKGEYKATAVFTAHNKDDLSDVGQAAARITLVIEN